MTTAAEFGLGSQEAANIAIIREHDLVVRPDADWFRGMPENYEDERGAPAHMGKFVAIRSIILVAPFPRAILHREIRAAPRGLDAEIADELIHAEREGMRLLNIQFDPFSKPVTDAGYFTFNRMGGQESVSLMMESTDYGRGDEETRERTAAFLRTSLLADGISVD
jgi:hypothetical protein